MPRVAKHRLRASERRRYSRLPMKMAVKYRSVEKDKISPLRTSRSDDLSAGGLGMHSLTRLKQGQMVVLSLVIPRGQKKVDVAAIRAFTKSPGQLTSILSRVVYCAPSDKKKKYKLGIQFLDLDTASRRLFRQFLIKSHMLKPTSRLYT
jgi:c-di-GMP-binding flagellar brake protein YcgR